MDGTSGLATMRRVMDRLSTRMLILAALMTVITMAIAIGIYYAATYADLIETAGRMPPRARAELEYLIATGQKGSDRFFELYDKYSGDTLTVVDLGLITIITVVSTIIGGAIVFAFARRISRPVTAVAKAAAQVARGDRSVRVDPAGSSGEIGEMVDSFNRMASDIDAYERERTVLTAGIAHELRTPLTILRGRLHGLVDGVIDPVTGEAERLLRQVDQLSRTVEDLRTLAHAEAGELGLDLRQVDAAEVMKTTASDFQNSALAADVLLKLDTCTTKVRADPVRLYQILANLITNAIKHAPPGSSIMLRAEPSGEEALLRVEDSGPGFQPEDVQRLFMPFWRASANREAGRPGSGMGLALAAKLAEAHGGNLTAANRADTSGAIFTLRLPLAPHGPKQVARSPGDRARFRLAIGLKRGADGRIAR